jgi:hypothetical protein
MENGMKIRLLLALIAAALPLGIVAAQTDATEVRR